MITEHGIHRQHDLAIAAASLSRALKDLANREDVTDHVGLSTLADVAAVAADAMERQWHCTRRELDL